jgi:hypothetical protein
LRLRRIRAIAVAIDSELNSRRLEAGGYSVGGGKDVLWVFKDFFN